MALGRSAKKRVRQTERHTLRNKVRKEKLKKIVRKFADTVKGGDLNAAATELVQDQKATAKAGSKGWLHKRAVARRKSRLAKTLNRARAAAKTA